MSNREEPLSKVALAPCGFRIRGVEPERGKMRRKATRRGMLIGKNIIEGKFLPYCSRAKGADEKRREAKCMEG